MKLIKNGIHQNIFSNLKKTNPTYFTSVKEGPPPRENLVARGLQSPYIKKIRQIDKKWNPSKYFHELNNSSNQNHEPRDFLVGGALSLLN